MGELRDGVEQLEPDEASQLLDDGALLLDVREPEEWAAGHAPGAVHVPMGEIVERHAGVLHRDQRIVAVCRSGTRSQRVAHFLTQAGYDAVNLAGGMQAWAASGRPVVTDSGDAGQVA